MAKKKAPRARRKFGYIRLLPSGMYQASYKRTIGGVLRTFYNEPECFATEREAEAWLAQEHLLILKGKWTEPGTPNPLNTETPTFEQYATRHIELQTNIHGVPLKPSTKEKYRSYINGPLRDFKRVRLSDISKIAVDEWWSKTVRSGKLTTSSKAYKFLHAVMKRAIADGYYQLANPCQVRGAHNATTGVATYTPSLSEVAAILEHMPLNLQAMTVLATFSAMRFGEVSALTAGDLKRIDVNGVQRYEVSITKSVTYVGREFLLGTPKNQAGMGTVVLSSAATSLLDEYLGSLGDIEEQRLLFPYKDGGYMPNHHYARALKNARQAAQLPDRRITPHALRRAGGTSYANNGANLGEVMKFIRDSTPKAALSYIKDTDRALGLAESMRLPS